jgi:hypothetical protein
MIPTPVPLSQVLAPRQHFELPHDLTHADVKHLQDPHVMATFKLDGQSVLLHFRSHQGIQVTTRNGYKRWWIQTPRLNFAALEHLKLEGEWMESDHSIIIHSVQSDTKKDFLDHMRETYQQVHQFSLFHRDAVLCRPTLWPCSPQKVLWKPSVDFGFHGPQPGPTRWLLWKPFYPPGELGPREFRFGIPFRTDPDGVIYIHRMLPQRWKYKKHLTVDVRLLRLRDTSHPPPYSWEASLREDHPFPFPVWTHEDVPGNVIAECVLHEQQWWIQRLRPDKKHPNHWNTCDTMLRRGTLDLQDITQQTQVKAISTLVAFDPSKHERLFPITPTPPLKVHVVTHPKWIQGPSQTWVVEELVLEGNPTFSSDDLKLQPNLTWNLSEIQSIFHSTVPDSQWEVIRKLLFVSPIPESTLQLDAQVKDQLTRSYQVSNSLHRQAHLSAEKFPWLLHQLEPREDVPLQDSNRCLSHTVFMGRTALLTTFSFRSILIHYMIYVIRQGVDLDPLVRVGLHRALTQYNMDEGDEVMYYGLAHPLPDRLTTDTYSLKLIPCYKTVKDIHMFLHHSHHETYYLNYMFPWWMQYQHPELQNPHWSEFVRQYYRCLFYSVTHQSFRCMEVLPFSDDWIRHRLPSWVPDDQPLNWSWDRETFLTYVGSWIVQVYKDPYTHMYIYRRVTDRYTQFQLKSGSDLRHHQHEALRYFMGRLPDGCPIWKEDETMLQFWNVHPHESYISSSWPEHRPAMRGGLFQLPCGMGKTFNLMSVVLLSGLPFLCVAPSALIHPLYHHMLTHMGGYQVRQMWIWNDHRAQPVPDYVLGVFVSLESLQHFVQSEHCPLRTRVFHLIIDEVHRITGDTYIEALESLNHPFYEDIHVAKRRVRVYPKRYLGLIHAASGTFYLDKHIHCLRVKQFLSNHPLLEVPRIVIFQQPREHWIACHAISRIHIRFMPIPLHPAWIHLRPYVDGSRMQETLIYTLNPMKLLALMDMWAIRCHEPSGGLFISCAHLFMVELIKSLGGMSHPVLDGSTSARERHVLMEYMTRPHGNHRPSLIVTQAGGTGMDMKYTTEGIDMGFMRGSIIRLLQSIGRLGRNPQEQKLDKSYTFILTEHSLDWEGAHEMIPYLEKEYGPVTSTSWSRASTCMDSESKYWTKERVMSVVHDDHPPLDMDPIHRAIWYALHYPFVTQRTELKMSLREKTFHR